MDTAPLLLFAVLAVLAGATSYSYCVRNGPYIWGMNEPLPETGERRLRAYLARLAEVLGHADRNERMVGYCTAPLWPGERKSVEPMAARLDPAHVSSLHQALHHFVATAP